jgi:hypothetical protein
MLGLERLEFAEEAVVLRVGISGASETLSLLRPLRLLRSLAGALDLLAQTGNLVRG